MAFIYMIKILIEQWRRRRDRMMIRDRKDSATSGKKGDNWAAYQVKSRTARSLGRRGSGQGL